MKSLACAIKRRAAARRRDWFTMPQHRFVEQIDLLGAVSRRTGGSRRSSAISNISLSAASPAGRHLQLLGAAVGRVGQALDQPVGFERIEHAGEVGPSIRRRLAISTCALSGGELMIAASASIRAELWFERAELLVQQPSASAGRPAPARWSAVCRRWSYPAPDRARTNCRCAVRVIIHGRSLSKPSTRSQTYGHPSPESHRLSFLDAHHGALRAAWQFPAAHRPKKSTHCSYQSAPLSFSGMEHMVGRLVADHDRGGVGVALRDRRHHRGVGDPQPLDLRAGAGRRRAPRPDRPPCRSSRSRPGGTSRSRRAGHSRAAPPCFRTRAGPVLGEHMAGDRPAGA